MSKANCVKPNPANRSALAELEQKRVLHRERSGLRHIVRAGTQMVEPNGFSHYCFSAAHERLANFHPNAPQVSGWVAYNNGRAEMTATPGTLNWKGTPYDLSSVFPSNTLADDLFRQAGTKSGTGLQPGACFYGDAVLVTDARMHWIFRTWKAELEEIDTFDAMLSTPRSLIKSQAGDYAVIFFHEEPNVVDLVSLKLRWM
jgi:hypothetical protein